MPVWNVYLKSPPEKQPSPAKLDWSMSPSSPSCPHLPFLGESAVSRPTSPTLESPRPQFRTHSSKSSPTCAQPPLPPIALPRHSLRVTTPSLPPFPPWDPRPSQQPQTVHISVTTTSITALQLRQHTILPFSPSSTPPLESFDLPGPSQPPGTSIPHSFHHTPTLVHRRSPFLLQGLSFLPFQVSAQLAPALPKDLLLHDISMIHNARTAAGTTHPHLRAQSGHSHLHQMPLAPIHPKSMTRTMANCRLLV